MSQMAVKGLNFRIIEHIRPEITKKAC